MRRRKSNNLLY